MQSITSKTYHNPRACEVDLNGIGTKTRSFDDIDLLLNEIFMFHIDNQHFGVICYIPDKFVL